MRNLLFGFAGLMAVLLLAGAGGTARLLYPGLAVILAAVVFVKKREYYMDFLLWCWFLSPFLRRVMDYQAGWKDPSIVLLTPYLVAFVPVVLGWKTLSGKPLNSVFPFAIALVAIVYGALIGVMFNPVTAIVAALMTWATPVLFAFWYASAGAKDQEFVKQSIERSFMYGLLVMGAYAVIQFVYAPAWDGNWLIQLGATADVSSMGMPEPYQIRVFSTLNSASVLALTSATGMLLLSTKKSWLATLAIVSGLAALVLTQGRSAWLCFAVGLLLLSFKNVKGLIRMAVICGVAGLIVIPVLFAGPAAEAFQNRFATVNSLAADESANARKKGLSEAVNMVAQNPAGFGLGVSEDVIANDGSFSLHDSGLVEAFMTLGYVVGPLYLGSLLYLAFTAFPRKAGNTKVWALGGVISLALLSQLPLGSVYLGLPGFVVWLFAAMAVYGGELPARMPMSPLSEAAVLRPGKVWGHEGAFVTQKDGASRPI